MTGHPVPQGYVLRRPRPAEARELQAVLDAAESDACGEPRRHEIIVATRWMDPACRLDQDWWVVEHAGTVVGVAWVSPNGDDVAADHYVHPEHHGRGLGELLIDTILARAAELPGRTEDGEARRVVVWCEDGDMVRRDALERRGWVRAGRQYYEMAVDLPISEAPFTWPRGIEIRHFRPGLDDHRVYAADQEAFAEHFLFTPRTFEQWRRRNLEAPDADHTLWRLAWDGGELAGFVTAAELADGGVISEFAVRKPWRGRGIGHALLGEAFAALRERGETIARLYVDAQNVTGAVRVYRAAGMRVARRFDVLQKPLA